MPWIHGDHWLELSVLKQRWLTDLQGRCLKAGEGLGSVLNGVEDDYRPHLTLGMTYDSTIRCSDLPRELVRGSTAGWSFRLGVAGDHLTLRQVLPWHS